ncbi:hypothetical protein [Methanoculleus chikugoensis]|uniref:RQC domain-containing protein n=1 Tax=Methanoculleus chikugoensis TaxID=118126 RepID=UPI001FB2C37D|nr:RQC domain-containing protein [Methanoculleus chikugoensis]
MRCRRTSPIAKPERCSTTARPPGAGGSSCSPTSASPTPPKSGAARATAARQRSGSLTGQRSRRRSSPASARPGERFGASYVADVLTGSKNTRIRENGHDRLPAYGSGGGYTRDQWLLFIQEMVGKGFVTSTGGRYPPRSRAKRPEPGGARGGDPGTARRAAS